MTRLLSGREARRLVQQTKGNTKSSDLVVRYLRVFGVTDFSNKTLPKCFNESYQPEWNAFIEASATTSVGAHKTKEEIALDKTLSFLNYCRTVKIDPLADGFKFVDPITKSNRLDINLIDRRLSKNSLERLFRAISAWAFRSQLSRYFKITKTLYQYKSLGSNYRVVVAYVLSVDVRKTKDFDSALLGLEGSTGLYSGNIPPQLTGVYKTVGKKQIDQRLKPEQLLGLGIIGWIPLIKSPLYQIYATRAKNNTLVIKVFLDPDLPKDLPTTDKISILKLKLKQLKALRLF